MSTPAIIERQRIRLKADSIAFYPPRNLLTSPQRYTKLRTGSAAQFEVTHFFANALASVENFSFVTCEIKALSSSGGAPLPESTPLAQSILAASEFDASITLAQFNAGTHQHFLFAFSEG